MNLRYIAFIIAVIFALIALFQISRHGPGKPSLTIEVKIAKLLAGEKVQFVDHWHLMRAIETLYTHGEITTEQAQKARSAEMFFQLPIDLVQTPVPGNNDFGGYDFPPEKVR